MKGPKKASSDAERLTILKFKRKKTTYVLPVNVDRTDLTSLISQLCNIINRSGGLFLEEPNNNSEEDYLSIPESAYIEQDGGAQTEDPKKLSGLHVESSDLTVALPEDKSSPYTNSWKQINKNEEFKEISFSDFDILAFKYTSDSDYYIEESAYDE